jgi:hypothetical protein
MLVDESMSAGEHQVAIDINTVHALVSGTYFCRLHVNGSVHLQRLVVVR